MLGDGGCAFSSTRLMDDVLVPAPTRRRLRGAVKTVNRVLGAVYLEKHPDKTFICRIERGFDFLGYHFSLNGAAGGHADDYEFHRESISALERRAGLTAHPLEMSVRRWLWWPVSGLRGLFLARFLPTDPQAYALTAQS